jgi:hypothetical protein
LRAAPLQRVDHESPWRVAVEQFTHQVVVCIAGAPG